MLLIERTRLDSSMLKGLRFAVTMGILAAAGACGTSDKPGMSTAGTQVLPTDGSTVSCTDDPRVDVYTANLKKVGQRGVLTFTLVESNPAPPARRTNVLKLRVDDMDGTAVTGDLLAVLKMPDHGHNVQVQPLVTFDASSATYTIDPVYLFMAGVWRLEFDAYAVDSDAGVLLDTGVYFFCIEG